MMRLEPKKVPVSNEPPEIFHWFCCDRNTALCGSDLSEVPITDGDGEQRCIVCHDLYENKIPCPGC